MPRVPTCQLAARMRSGIVSVERAPSGSTQCFCCMTAIGEGSIRVWYQVKPTTSLRDRKRAHLFCSRHFALANREHDVRQLTEAVNGEDAAWTPEEQLMCVEAIAAMGSVSSSSASTGPASAGYFAPQDNNNCTRQFRQGKNLHAARGVANSGG